MRSPDEHPTHFGKDEPPSLTERATFGHDAVRDPVSGRIFELGSGCLPREQQALLFGAEAVKGSKLTELEARLLLQAGKAPVA
jgi:hypothetical protein